MTATDELRRMLDERGVEYATDDNNASNVTMWTTQNGGWAFDCDYMEPLNAKPGTIGAKTELMIYGYTPEQAVVATFGRPKAKAHPYGYEPDTGAFDVTRCECGCLNDISATYCNECGGEIEIDMNAEKEIYHRSRHLVFAEKHDDGSLEFGGKRYIAKGDA